MTAWPPTAPPAATRCCATAPKAPRRRIRDRGAGSSGLRGLGGAGFPAGRKWRIVRAEAGPRLMAINIDEGEPGTFKDRVYLERDPHRFLEGALIAAWAVGIETIYIYLRDEYHGCAACWKPSWQALRADPPVANMPQIECGAAPAPTSAAKSRP
jgi:Na+-translocating ferredoxin:NAD+ oxidoreductase RnfC subunit